MPTETFSSLAAHHGLKTKTPRVSAAMRQGAAEELVKRACDPGRSETTSHQEWLGKLWPVLRHNKRPAARVLFPVPSQRTGYARNAIRAVEGLESMALSLHIAMEARLQGNIQKAMVYEGHADLAYDRLPAFAKDAGDALSNYGNPLPGEY